MNEPAAPTPDDKDWTWVLDRPCPECGFAAGEVDHHDVSALLRANTAEWLEVLRRPDVRNRPAPAVWSPLEYACHVRDVHVLYLQRLEMMLTEDAPHYPNWDQDETAVSSRYHDADPTVVARQFEEASDALAARFDEVDGAAFTVITFARYFIHDPIHHLHDVGVR